MTVLIGLTAVRYLLLAALLLWLGMAVPGPTRPVVRALLVAMLALVILPAELWRVGPAQVWGQGVLTFLRDWMSNAYPLLGLLALLSWIGGALDDGAGRRQQVSLGAALVGISVIDDANAWLAPYLESAGLTPVLGWALQIAVYAGALVIAITLAELLMARRAGAPRWGGFILTGLTASAWLGGAFVGVIGIQHPGSEPFAYVPYGLGFSALGGVLTALLGRLIPARRRATTAGRSRRLAWLPALALVCAPVPALAECEALAKLIAAGDIAAAERLVGGIAPNPPHPQCDILLAEYYAGLGDGDKADRYGEHAWRFADPADRAIYARVLFYRVVHADAYRSQAVELRRLDPALAQRALAERERVHGDNGKPAAEKISFPLLRVGPEDATAAQSLLKAGCPPDLVDARRNGSLGDDTQARAMDGGIGCVQAWLRVKAGTADTGLRPAVADDSRAGGDPLVMGKTRPSVSAPGQSRQRIDLERDIEAAVANDGALVSTRAAGWRERARQLPGGALSPGYERLLRLLEDHQRCVLIFHLHPQQSLDEVCKKFGPIIEATGKGSGVRHVYYDREVADRLVSEALQDAIASPPPTGKATITDRDARPDKSLAEVFSSVQTDLLRLPGLAKSPDKFKGRVAIALTDNGHSVDCISPDTWKAIRPEKAWVWVAYADCGLSEGKWADAADGLDKAARSIRPTGSEPLKDLVVARLLALQQLADTAGQTDYGRRGLANRIGLKPESKWLRTKLAEANEAGGNLKPAVPVRNASDNGPSPSSATTRQDDQPCKEVLLTGTGGGVVSVGNCSAGNGHLSRTGNRYTTDWNRLSDLPYYEILDRKTRGWFITSAQPILIAAEKAAPWMFDTFTLWDAVALGKGPSSVGGSELWLVKQLYKAEPARLTPLANTLGASVESYKLADGKSYEVRQFILRHALARRALELGCSQLARRELGLIPPNYFGDGKVPQAFGAFHDRVVSAAEKMPDSGACIQAPVTEPAAPEPSPLPSDKGR